MKVFQISRFIAIPVKLGDAFYLKTPEGSVLVDGGGSKSCFPRLFKIYTRQNSVDIVIATHNDSDHTSGIIGFLDSDLKCDEIWLPSNWAGLLPHVIRPLDEIVYLLIKQVSKIKEFEYREDIGSLLEQYAEREKEKLKNLQTETYELELDEFGWPKNDEILLLLEKASEEEEELFTSSLSLFIYWLLLWKYPPYPIIVELSRQQFLLLLEALKSAERIRLIAIKAYNRGIPVRWFKYDITNPGGGYVWLKPLNSCEIYTVYPLKESQFLMALALSVLNKESLVFSAPPPNAGTGVIFTADSDLDGVTLPQWINDETIITAPHHGSKHNKNVYNKINQPVIWVRSDSKSGSRPCSEYINANGQKFCTICKNTSQKQAIYFRETFKHWKAYHCKPCICK